MAVEYCPAKPSYVLNLMHAYELLQDYSEAIDLAVAFFRLTRYLSLTEKEQSCDACMDIMPALEPFQVSLTQSGSMHTKSLFPDMRFEFCGRQISGVFLIRDLHAAGVYQLSGFCPTCLSSHHC